MEVADSLLDLVGNTPMVRLDRVASGSTASCWPSSSCSTRAAREGPAGPRHDRGGRARTGCCSRAARSSSRRRATPAWAWPSSPPAAATTACSSCPTRWRRRRSSCCGPTAPRWSSAPRRSSPSTPTRTTRWPTAWHARSRARASPTSTTTPTTPRPSTDHRAGDLAADRRARSPTSWPASAPAARSPASAATSRSRTRTSHHRRRPRGLGLLRRHGPALPRRGHRRGLLAHHLRPVGRRRGHRRQRRRTRSPRPGGSPGRRACSSAAPAAPPSPPPCEVGEGLGPEAVVVVIIPDSGRGYLSKLYDDGWMADYGFLPPSGQTVGDVLRPQARRPARRSCTPTPTRRCATPSTSCGSSRCPRCRSCSTSRRSSWPR